MRMLRRHAPFRADPTLRTLCSVQMLINDPLPHSTLNNLRERFAEWAKKDVIQSYLQSDAIQEGVEKLAEELRWCGLHTEVRTKLSSFIGLASLTGWFSTGFAVG